jgi:hypothetical protein
MEPGLQIVRGRLTTRDVVTSVMGYHPRLELLRGLNGTRRYKWGLELSIILNGNTSHRSNIFSELQRLQHVRPMPSCSIRPSTVLARLTHAEAAEGAPAVSTADGSDGAGPSATVFDFGARAQPENDTVWSSMVDAIVRATAKERRAHDQRVIPMDFKIGDDVLATCLRQGHQLMATTNSPRRGGAHV